MSLDLSKTIYSSLYEAEQIAENYAALFNTQMEQFAGIIKEIKESRLWEQMPGVQSFPDYCEKRWGKSMRTVQRLVSAHKHRRELLLEARQEDREAILALPVTRLAPKKAVAVAKKCGIGHLLIGRKEPTATKTVDFYSSPNPQPKQDPDPKPNFEAVAAGSLRFPEDHCFTSYEEFLNVIQGLKPDGMIKRFESETAAKVLRSHPLKDESHRGYLNHVADSIEKGEPA